MLTPNVPLILASASPRRREFLSQLGLPFQVIPAAIDESVHAQESPERYVARMAAGKADHLSTTYPEACVIAADTIVVLDGIIFGKPADKTHALAMLEELQGRTHLVMTAMALRLQRTSLQVQETVTTEVTFDTFPRPLLQAYVNTGEPMDKAGAYGIQGIGTFLVRTINGSYSNVVGLPVNRLLTLLLQQQIIAYT